MALGEYDWDKTYQLALIIQHELIFFQVAESTSMTYSSCQNMGPVILRVLKIYIRIILKVPLNFLMFKDAGEGGR